MKSQQISVLRPSYQLSGDAFVAVWLASLHSIYAIYEKPVHCCKEKERIRIQRPALLHYYIAGEQPAVARLYWARQRTAIKGTTTVFMMSVGTAGWKSHNTTHIDAQIGGTEEEEATNMLHNNQGISRLTSHKVFVILDNLKNTPSNKEIKTCNPDP
jgi:hypothetical protein